VVCRSEARLLLRFCNERKLAVQALIKDRRQVTTIDSRAIVFLERASFKFLDHTGSGPADTASDNFRLGRHTARLAASSALHPEMLEAAKPKLIVVIATQMLPGGYRVLFGGTSGQFGTPSDFMIASNRASPRSGSYNGSVLMKSANRFRSLHAFASHCRACSF
jgi:hypothetical protein